MNHCLTRPPSRRGWTSFQSCPHPSTIPLSISLIYQKKKPSLELPVCTLLPHKSVFLSHTFFIIGGMKVKADRDESSPYAAMLTAQDVATRCCEVGVMALHIKLCATGGTGTKPPGPGTFSPCWHAYWTHWRCYSHPYLFHKMQGMYLYFWRKVHLCINHYIFSCKILHVLDTVSISSIQVKRACKFEIHRDCASATSIDIYCQV